MRRWEGEDSERERRDTIIKFLFESFYPNPRGINRTLRTPRSLGTHSIWASRVPSFRRSVFELNRPAVETQIFERPPMQGSKTRNDGLHEPHVVVERDSCVDHKKKASRAKKAMPTVASATCLPPSASDVLPPISAVVD